MAPVVWALRARRDEVETRVVLTGQHTTLVDGMVDVLDLRPDYDLAIMREGQDLHHVARACLEGMRPVLEVERPDLVLVQGDTATVFFASLGGFFQRIRVGHVEAGLRSGDRWAPFPEEIFRRLTDVLAELHFAPTLGAREHLLAEGVPPGGIHVTGNTVVDALLSVAGREEAGAAEASDPGLREALASPERIVLLTAHRRESFGAPLREIFSGVRELTDAEEDVRVVYPVHPNPDVRGPAEEILAGHPRIHLTPPLGYLDLVRALRAATLVLTDSGGIQEEAPAFGTPVLVLREVTERPEGIDAGVARLVGTDRERIVDEARRLLADPGAREAMSSAENPYGDGHAGERIADVVVATLTGAPRRTEDWR